MLTESTHSATGDTAGTDPIFALDTDVATCAVVPEKEWWNVVGGKSRKWIFRIQGGFHIISWTFR